MRPIEVPNVPDSELADLVRLQVATRSAVPLDDLKLDYVLSPRPATPEGREIVTATIPSGLLRDIQTVCSAARLQPVSVSLSSTAFVALANQREGRDAGRTEKATLLIAPGAKNAEFSLIHHGRLLISHCATLAEDDHEERLQNLLSETGRLVFSAAGAGEDGSLGHVWVLDQGASNAGLTDGLESRLECEGVELLDPFQLKRVTKKGCEVSGPTGRYAIAVGRLLSEVDSSLMAFDFLNPRKPPVRRDRRKLQIGMAVAGVLLCLGLAYGLYQGQVSQLDIDIARMLNEQTDLDQIIEEGKPDVESATTINQWNSRTVDWFGQLRELDAVLKGTGRTYFTDLKFSTATSGTAAHIRAGIFARERADVELLNQNLDVKGYRVTPQPIRLTRKDPQFPYESEIDVDLPDPSDEEKSGSAPSPAVSKTATSAPSGDT
jgi:hypothetical protein